MTASTLLDVLIVDDSAPFRVAARELLEHRGTVQWLSETDVAERLRALREDHAAWRSDRDSGWLVCMR